MLRSSRIRARRQTARVPGPIPAALVAAGTSSLRTAQKGPRKWRIVLHSPKGTPAPLPLGGGLAGPGPGSFILPPATRSSSASFSVERAALQPAVFTVCGLSVISGILSWTPPRREYYPHHPERTVRRITVEALIAGACQPRSRLLRRWRTHGAFQGSSASRALASRKSLVSKPSVNQA
jgi:hypothetical protein